MNSPIGSVFQTEENQVEEKKPQKTGNILEYLESPELNKLYEALAKTQLEMSTAKTDKRNPYFKSKYADLNSVVIASRSFLARNGICVTQRTFKADSGMDFLHTRMGHSSGQWIASNIEVKPLKGDIQSLGSYLTYLRRYQYAALVGVITGDDDDGESAMKETRIEATEAREITENLSINRTQLETLSKELSNNPDILERILKGYKIQKISDIPAKDYIGCLARINNIKSGETTCKK